MPFTPDFPGPGDAVRFTGDGIIQAGDTGDSAEMAGAIEDFNAGIYARARGFTDVASIRLTSAPYPYRAGQVIQVRVSSLRPAAVNESE